MSIFNSKTGTTIPSLKEIMAAVRSDITSRMDGQESYSRFIASMIFAPVHAAALYAIYLFLGGEKNPSLVNQILPDTATAEVLSRHGAIHGVTRGAATAATGFARVYAVNGSVLPISSVLVDVNGHEYTTDVATTWTATEYRFIAVTASATGTDSNIDAGADLTVSSPPAGVTAEAVAETGGITGGGAGAASGQIEVYAIGGSVLPNAHGISHGDGNDYTTDDTTTWVATGYRCLTITATGPGVAWDRDPGEPLTVDAAVPAGVEANCYVSLDGIHSGTDVETDASLLTRLLQNIRETPQGGAVADYRAWVLEALPGIADRVFVVDCPTAETGHVDIYFTVAGDDHVPTAAQVTDVDDYIGNLDEDRRPVTADVSVAAPTENAITLTITLTEADNYLTADVQANILSELQAMLEEKQTELGTTIKNSWLRDAIGDAEGVEYFTLDVVDGGAALADITQTSTELATIVAGGITWP